jgi:antitoxin VapB
MLQTAKLFTNGSSQAVRLPKEFRFQGTEVYVQKVGGCLLLSPKDRAWETFMEGVSGFSDDYFDAIEQARSEDIPSARETL